VFFYFLSVIEGWQPKNVMLYEKIKACSTVNLLQTIVRFKVYIILFFRDFTVKTVCRLKGSRTHVIFFFFFGAFINYKSLWLIHLNSQLNLVLFGFDFLFIFFFCLTYYAYDTYIILMLIILIVNSNVFKYFFVYCFTYTYFVYYYFKYICSRIYHRD